MFTRLLLFAYGLSSSAIVLATFIYAVAFVGGFTGSSRLDGEPRTTLALALAIDCALLTLFAALQSVLAGRRFREWRRRLVPWTVERSSDVLCGSLALLLLVWLWQPIGIPIWTVEHAAPRGALWALFAAGWLTVAVGAFLIDHGDLSGLRQVWLPLTGRPYLPMTVRTPLPDRVVRQHLYLGFLLAFWATPTMTLAHLAFAITATAHVGLAIQNEGGGSSDWVIE